MDTLLYTAQQWLQSDRRTAFQVIERVVMDRFLRAVPSKEQKAVGMQDTKTP